MLRAIVIDDEEDGIEMVKMLALRNPSVIRIIASSLAPEEGIKLIEDYRPDVVFLDISMPVMNGFELLANLRFRDFKLVFTTAHRDHALQAIQNRAFDYLLKPIDSDVFKKCVEDLHKEIAPAILPSKPNPASVLELQVKDGIIYLKQKDILRLEASRNYTEIYLDNGQRHVASRSLREFEVKLDETLFYRCHKSHIVNLQKVQKFINHDGFYALMSDGSKASVSKNNKDEFLIYLKHIQA